MEMKNTVCRYVSKLLVAGIAIGVFSTIAFAKKGPQLKTQALLPSYVTKPIDTNGSFMNPRVPREKGPWFDGWYYRITDSQQNRSVAIIATSYLDPNETFSPQKPMKGYLAVLISPGPNKPLQIHEYFPQQTWLMMNNQVVSPETKYHNNPTFTWIAEGFGKVTANEVDLNLPEIQVKAKFDHQERKPWSYLLSDWGPGGITTYLTAVPLKWYVYTMGSPAEYSVISQSNGLALSGNGYAHQEKNWGALFPEKWIWLQGIAAGNKARLAMAGGTVPFGPTTIDKWVLTYQSNSTKLEFYSDQLGTEMLKKIDPENGFFEVQAVSYTHTLILKAKSPLSQFSLVSIPTAKGYLRGGAKESFSTEVVVEVYRNSFPFTVRSRNLIERQVFENAALEFGAEFMHSGK
jgi:hypothetical protein